jgi:hypothetical protein
VHLFIFYMTNREFRDIIKLFIKKHHLIQFDTLPSAKDGLLEKDLDLQFKEDK